MSWKASGKDTIGDVIAANAQARPDKVAVHFDSGGISFGELDRRSTAVANTLLGWGVRSGDAVAVLMENRPEMLDSWFGVAKMGGLYVPGPGRSRAPAATAPA